MLDEVAVASLAPLKIYLPLYLNCKIPELLFEDKLPPIVILLLDVIKEKPSGEIYNFALSELVVLPENIGPNTISR